MVMNLRLTKNTLKLTVEETALSRFYWGVWWPVPGHHGLGFQIFPHEYQRLNSSQRVLLAPLFPESSRFSLLGGCVCIPSEDCLPMSHCPLKRAAPCLYSHCLAFVTHLSPCSAVFAASAINGKSLRAGDLLSLSLSLLAFLRPRLSQSHSSELRTKFNFSVHGPCSHCESCRGERGQEGGKEARLRKRILVQTSPPEGKMVLPG